MDNSSSNDGEGVTCSTCTSSPAVVVAGQKRARASSPPAASKEQPQQQAPNNVMSSSSSMGRGRGRNLPAWMTSSESVDNGLGMAPTVGATQEPLMTRLSPPPPPTPPPLPPPPKLWKLDWMDVTLGRARNTSSKRKRPHTMNTTTTTDNKVAVVDLLQTNATILLRGRGSLCCTRGSVEIHGYHLTAASNQKKKKNLSLHQLKKQLKFIPFDVPSWSTSWLTVTATTCKDGAQLYLCSARTTTTTNNDSKQEEATFSVHDGLEEAARPTVLPDGWKQSAQEILRDYHEQQQQQHRNSPPPEQERETNHNKNEDLSNIIESGSDDDSRRGGHGFVVAITGGKSVGKSTYLRYLLHRFMSSSPDACTSKCPPNNNTNRPRYIAILDGDPGQPELGPVGIMTLTILRIGGKDGARRPLWSPPHLNMVLPSNDDDCNHDAWTMPPPAIQYERAYYYGSTTVQTHPEQYLQCMSQLVKVYHDWNSSQQKSQHYATTTTMTPLLINMHGWVKGLGYTLLEALLQLHLQPCRHVVQILGTLNSQLFDLHSILEQSKQASHCSGGGGDDDTYLHVMPCFLQNGPYSCQRFSAIVNEAADDASVNANNNPEQAPLSLQERREQFASRAATSSASFRSIESYSAEDEDMVKINEQEEGRGDEDVQEDSSTLGVAGTKLTPPPTPDPTMTPPADSATKGASSNGLLFEPMDDADTTTATNAALVQPMTESTRTTDAVNVTFATTVEGAAPTPQAESSIYIMYNQHWSRMMAVNKGPSIPAAAFRTLRLCTYFTANTPLAVHTWPQHDIAFTQKGGLEDPGQKIAHCLAATKPYVVPMECLSVRHVFEENNNSQDNNDQQWWHLLNASIVGLCYDQEEDNRASNIDDDAVDDPSPPRCVGLGIVRAIDWQRKLLFLLTPIAPDQLTRVHILMVGGNLVLPLQCTFRGVNSESFPYQSQNNPRKMRHLAGAEPMKSRNTLVHRRQTPPAPTW